MEFQKLLDQLSLLEQENKNEEKKFIAEFSSHQQTKKSLVQCEQTLAQKKKRELELIERIANLECENTTNSKIIADLKSSLQLSEQNLVHMKEHFEKEVQIMNDKREFFVKKIDELSEHLRISVRSPEQGALIEQIVLLKKEKQELVGSLAYQIKEKEKERLNVVNAQEEKFKKIEKLNAELENQLRQSQNAMSEMRCSSCARSVRR